LDKGGFVLLVDSFAWHRFVKGGQNCYISYLQERRQDQFQ